MGYWNIKGDAEQIRVLLHYAGMDFLDKRYDYGPAPDYSCAEWSNDQRELDLPSADLPYYIEGDLKLVEVSVKRFWRD